MRLVWLEWTAGLALAAVLFAGVAGAQTFPGSTINTSGNSLIPSVGTGGCSVAPQTTGGTVFNATVAGLSTDAEILKVEMNLTHTFDSDLDIFLRAPNGQILELTSDNGGGGDNFTDTVFKDGWPSITAGTPPFTFTFSPEGWIAASCAALTGNVPDLEGFVAGQNGVWQLVIMDDLGADGGNMLGWSITSGLLLSGFENGFLDWAVSP